MAVKETQGIVQSTFTKDWYDKRENANIILHSFRLEGDKTYYRTGTTPPPFNRGDAIAFEYDDRSGNVVTESIREVEGEVARAPAPEPRRNTGGRQGSYSGGAGRSGGGASAGGARDNYWKEKEERDIEREVRYQQVVEPRMIVMAAQERAVGIVAAALANDCLSFGNTAKGAKFDMLMGFVDEATDHFIQQALIAPQLVDKAGKPAAKGAASNDEEDWNNNDD